MKRIALTIVSVALTFVAFATLPSGKFGKPSSEELEMKVCPLDSTAEAMCLSEMSKVYYTFTSDGMRRVLENEVRIKVFKEAGKSRGNVAQPYPDEINERRTFLSGISATSYNLENGKVVKTKLESKDIFYSKPSEGICKMKFSVPNIKEGTVFEYKYTLTTDFVEYLDLYHFQMSIPVAYSRLDLDIPEMFDFKPNLIGRHKVDVTTGLGQIAIAGTSVGPNSSPQFLPTKKLSYEAHDVPAMKNEGNVWNIGDYKTHVSFTLEKFSPPFGKVITFSVGWDDIFDNLKKSKLGENWKLSNPFKADMASLQLDKCATNCEKVAKIFQFVSSKVKWNRQIGRDTENVTNDIKKGEGNNACINFIVMSMMRDAGVEPTPVMVRSRSRGRVIINPSPDTFDSFVVEFSETDGSKHFIDGTSQYGYIDAFNPELSTDCAHELDHNETIDLTRITKSGETSYMEASVGADGIIHGNIKSQLHGFHSCLWNLSLASASDVNDIITGQENSSEIKMTAHTFNDPHEFAPTAKIAFDFEKECLSDGDKIYFNPLVIPDEKHNPFTKDERFYPIEMSYPKSNSFTVRVTIPDGYEIEEMPKPTKVVLACAPANYCQLRVSKESENSILVSYRINLPDIFFDTDQYNDLKAFWAQVIKLNDSVVVLHRK